MSAPFYFGLLCFHHYVKINYQILSLFFLLAPKTLAVDPSCGYIQIWSKIEHYSLHNFNFFYSGPGLDSRRNVPASASSPVLIIKTQRSTTMFSDTKWKQRKENSEPSKIFHIKHHFVKKAALFRLLWNYDKKERERKEGVVEKLRKVTRMSF